MNAEDIVGYTYNAEAYCPRCVKTLKVKQEELGVMFSDAEVDCPGEYCCICREKMDCRVICPEGCECSHRDLDEE